MSQKYCVRCKTVKDIMPSPYSRNKGVNGNVTSEYYLCRSCNTERIKKYRKTENGKRNTAKANRASEARLSARRRARGLIARAVKAGFILKPEQCSQCGAVAALDAHHPDYDKPLEVIWLCRQCHANIHRKA